MSEPTTVRFAAGGREVSLLLQTRPYATAQLDWDRDAVTAVVAAKAGAFRGVFATTLWSHEIAYLRWLLIELQQHIGQERQVAFETIEPALNLTFRLLVLGHLHVRAQIRTDVGLETEALLEFSMVADQSYLPAWIAALTHALDVFPPHVHSAEVPP